MLFKYTAGSSRRHKMVFPGREKLLKLPADAPVSLTGFENTEVHTAHLPPLRH